MRAVIQRVSEASVTIDGRLYAAIKTGLLVLLGVEAIDNDQDAEWLTNKIINMRIFEDAQKVMNKSVLETAGEILVVSQFTLFASTKKGNRPSYIRAAKPDISIPLYEKFLSQMKTSGVSVKTGIFGADMQVSLINDGPVTILLDTHNKE